MQDAQPRAIYLKDYQPPAFLVDTVELCFVLEEDHTLVRSRLQLRRNPAASAAELPLVLNGQGLELLSIALDGQPLGPGDYTLDEETLTLSAIPDSFVFESEVRIQPQLNTALEGLYKSRGMFCTQCEAEGFRRITYYPDRPDVMGVFTTRIEADRARYPILLSNGNLIEQGELERGRHFAVWHDPFPKPCYLFALVGGDLQYLEDHFQTMSGRNVCLRIYVEPKDLDKCAHAMDSLKRAMSWDEQVYGREYDLDIYMIVAVDDFNMGAMENKGLNIFNTSCVLASPETTTDLGFQRVEAVVAHEYFHNWSGNRVTCRDWFQLSLKEGFTVFRDAEFSADMGSRTVKRIEEATVLRTLQFAEDAGPMAHPIRPASFIEISNFYTLTVYEKGAEVVRMLHTLLGPDLFRRGCDLYFDRHDGQAVTCDDFVRAMADVSGRDLTQFQRWYSQAGTPELEVSGHYDAEARRYRLNFRQSCPPSPGQPVKEPLHIPVAVGLVGTSGDIALQFEGEATGTTGTRLLEITETEQSFEFLNVCEPPVPSLLRSFSAPVRLHCDLTRDDLVFLMRRDSDGFNQWDACQRLAVEVLNDGINSHVAGGEIYIDDRILDAFEHLLASPDTDPAMLAHMLALPSEAYLSELADVIHVEAIHAARNSLRLAIARRAEDALWRRYNEAGTSSSYNTSANQIASRALRNTSLAYLVHTGNERALDMAMRQFDVASNMTDMSAAMACIVNCPSDLAMPMRASVLERFYQRWKAEALVVNQWFSVQAGCTLPGGLERVQALMSHSAFDPLNPNKLRAVIGTFSQQNAINFHRQDGRGYQFLADQIITLDDRNPQIASRLLTPLTRWRKYPQSLGAQMRNALEHIAAKPGLSRDVFEVVSKSL